MGLCEYYYWLISTVDFESFIENGYLTIKTYFNCKM